MAPCFRTTCENKMDFGVTGCHCCTQAPLMNSYLVSLCVIPANFKDTFTCYMYNELKYRLEVIQVEV